MLKILTIKCPECNHQQKESVWSDEFEMNLETGDIKNITCKKCDKKFIGQIKEVDGVEIFDTENIDLSME